MSFTGKEKAVASFVTTLLGILTALLTYAQFAPQYAKYISGAVAVLTPIASYLAVFKTTNTPAPAQATPQA